MKRNIELGNELLFHNYDFFYLSRLGISELCAERGQRRGGRYGLLRSSAKSYLSFPTRFLRVVRGWFGIFDGKNGGGNSTGVELKLWITLSKMQNPKLKEKPKSQIQT